MTEVVPSFAQARAKAEVFSDTKSPMHLRCLSFHQAIESVIGDDVVRYIVISDAPHYSSEIVLAKKTYGHFMLSRRVGGIIVIVELNIEGVLHVIPSIWGRDVSVCFDESLIADPEDYYENFRQSDRIKFNQLKSQITR